MSKVFTVISYLEDPERFLILLDRSAVANSTISSNEFMSEDSYQEAIEGDRYSNMSFCLEYDGGLQSVILAHKIGNIIQYNHLGVCIIALEENKKIISKSLEVLLSATQKEKAEALLIDDRCEHSDLSFIGSEAFNVSGVPHTKLEAIIDLTQSEEDIHRNLRKSYKSLVNQGRKEMNFVYVTSNNLSRDLFEDFRSFHKIVSGRVTRPEESWKVQFDMIAQGQAELILGYIEPHGLVSSALFNDVGDTTIYSVAVYDRGLFNYPLAHANVYEGVLRAKNRGQKTFYLGQVPAYGTVDEKEFNIGKFKKGFCDRLKSYIEWKIPV